MIEFTCTITDPVGLHARPAGLLVKAASAFGCDITLEKDGHGVSAKKLFAVMGLGVKCGDRVTVRCEGADEREASAALESFFKEKL